MGHQCPLTQLPSVSFIHEATGPSRSLRKVGWQAPRTPQTRLAGTLAPPSRVGACLSTSLMTGDFLQNTGENILFWGRSRAERGQKVGRETSVERRGTGMVDIGSVTGTRRTGEPEKGEQKPPQTARGMVVFWWCSGGVFCKHEKKDGSTGRIMRRQNHGNDRQRSAAFQKVVSARYFWRRPPFRGEPVFFIIIHGRTIAAGANMVAAPGTVIGWHIPAPSWPHISKQTCAIFRVFDRWD
jgi:hypothetical protein